MSKKITLYLIDGLPKGLRSVRIDQWIGKAVCAPRANIKKITPKDGPSGFEYHSSIYLNFKHEKDYIHHRVWVSGVTGCYAGAWGGGVGRA